MKGITNLLRDPLLRAFRSRIAREPLVHFLLVGVALFGLRAIVGEAPEAEDGKQITISAGDVEQLRSFWEKQWQRQPTTEELQDLIEQQVREEVFYREALALGLDRDDTIIRRRLVQKFEFLTEDIAASRDPAEAELASYFKVNEQRYRIPARISFRQIYFSQSRRGAGAADDAKLVLAGLGASGTARGDNAFGDGSMLDELYQDMTVQQIEATFGRAFAAAVFEHETGAWFGPVISEYGLHLVRIDSRDAARTPALTEITAKVRADLTYEQRRQASEAIYRRMRENYEITVSTASSASDASQGVLR